MRNRNKLFKESKEREDRERESCKQTEKKKIAEKRCCENGSTSMTMWFGVIPFIEEMFVCLCV